MTCLEGVMPKIRYDLEDMRDNSANFPKEVKFLMHKYGCARRDIVIDSQHPCGEDVIFIRGKWEGYLDESFYDEFDVF